jgi:AcrR family transcriptional regulator
MTIPKADHDNREAKQREQERRRNRRTAARPRAPATALRWGDTHDHRRSGEDGVRPFRLCRDRHDNVARRAGVSTKTLYRLFPNKAAVFEAMVTERIEAFVSVVKLRACDGSDVEAALAEALQVCADLMLDGEVIALQRVILADSDKFPDIAQTFFHKAITPTQNALANWLRVQQQRGTIELDDVDAAAGMLLGMLAFQPHRSVMFGHRPALTKEERDLRAKTCVKLFLRGCRRR